MFKPASHFYAFDTFLVDPLKRTILCDEKPLHLTPKAFDILIAFLENTGEAIDKNELMSKVWPDTIVEENNLTRNISSLRRALGETPDEHRYIVTIPGHGYSFVADVKRLPYRPPDVMIARHTRSQIVIEETRANPTIADSASPVVPNSSLVGKPRGFIRDHKRLAVLAAALILVAVSASAYLQYQRSVASGVPEPFQKMKPSKLTNIGNAVAAAISPDGEYVAYVVDEGGPQSLWLRRTSAEGKTRIVEPSDVDYWGLTFTPHGEYLYYVAWERNKTDAVLYRVPSLGGIPPQRLLNNVGTRVTFSPDGKMLAFVNDSSVEAKASLLVAEADGGQRKELLAVKHPDFFFDRPHMGPAWSPDGNSIATAFGPAGRRGLVKVDVADGTMNPISSHIWQEIGQVEWLSDGKGLVIVAKEEASEPNQLWHVSLPEGEVKRITNDLLDYSGVNASANSDVLVTVQHDTVTNLWIIPDGETSDAKQISDDKVGEFFSWTPENRIIYSSDVSGKSELWIMNSDGNDARQITIDGKVKGYISVSRDGQYVISASNRSGTYHIWRMNSDGSNPIQLTNGNGEVYSHLSPDGKWVVYRQGYGWVKSTIWKVAIDGGDPIQLTENQSLQPNVSPDGRLIAYYYMDANVWGLAIMPFEGGIPITRFRIPSSVSSRVVRWTPDGKAIAYINDVDGASNIWIQPIDGSSPKQLTNFTKFKIFYFDWSPDGKQMICSRGYTMDDVVLINDFR